MTEILELELSLPRDTEWDEWREVAAEKVQLSVGPARHSASSPQTL